MGDPIPGLDGAINLIPDLDGGTLSQVQMGGYPIPDPDGCTPSQVWMGVPHPTDRGWYPIPGLDRGYCHPRSGWGCPPLRTELGYPHQETDQQSEHLLCGRQCAFCIHTEDFLVHLYFQFWKFFLNIGYF